MSSSDVKNVPWEVSSVSLDDLVFALGPTVLVERPACLGQTVGQPFVVTGTKAFCRLQGDALAALSELARVVSKNKKLSRLERYCLKKTAGALRRRGRVDVAILRSALLSLAADRLSLISQANPWDRQAVETTACELTIATMYIHKQIAQTAS